MSTPDDMDFEVRETEEDGDWLPEESKRIAPRRQLADYQTKAGYCESCQ